MGNINEINLDELSKSSPEKLKSTFDYCTGVVQESAKKANRIIYEKLARPNPRLGEALLNSIRVSSEKPHYKFNSDVKEVNGRIFLDFNDSKRVDVTGNPMIQVLYYYAPELTVKEYMAKSYKYVSNRYNRFIEKSNVDIFSLENLLVAEIFALRAAKASLRGNADIILKHSKDMDLDYMEHDIDVAVRIISRHNKQLWRDYLYMVNCDDAVYRLAEQMNLSDEDLQLFKDFVYIDKEGTGKKSFEKFIDPIAEKIVPFEERPQAARLMKFIKQISGDSIANFVMEEFELTETVYSSTLEEFVSRCAKDEIPDFINIIPLEYRDFILEMIKNEKSRMENDLRWMKKAEVEKAEQEKIRKKEVESASVELTENLSKTFYKTIFATRKYKGDIYKRSLYQQPVFKKSRIRERNPKAEIWGFGFHRFVINAGIDFIHNLSDPEFELLKLNKLDTDKLVTSFKENMFGRIKDEFNEEVTDKYLDWIANKFLIPSLNTKLVYPTYDKRYDKDFFICKSISDILDNPEPYRLTPKDIKEIISNSYNKLQEREKNYGIKRTELRYSLEEYVKYVLLPLANSQTTKLGEELKDYLKILFLF